MSESHLMETSNPYGELDEREFIRFQNLLGGSLPSDYALYLESHNGGMFLNRYYRNPSDSNATAFVHFLFGLHAGPEDLQLAKNFRASDNYELQAFEEILKPYLVFGGDDGGSLFLIDLRSGEVCLFEVSAITDETNADVLSAVRLFAKNFASFVENLMSKEVFWKADKTDFDLEERVRIGRELTERLNREQAKKT